MKRRMVCFACYAECMIVKIHLTMKIKFTQVPVLKLKEYTAWMDTVAHNNMRWPIQREHNKQVSSPHPQPNERAMQNEEEEEIQN